jgi:hypothetical protein
MEREHERARSEHEIRYSIIQLLEELPHERRYAVARAIANLYRPADAGDYVRFDEHPHES